MYSKKLKEALSHMKQNRPFLLLMTANLFITMTYAQIFSTMPQILSAVNNGHNLYSTLVMTNPIVVIFTGFFLIEF